MPTRHRRCATQRRMK
ncbi:TPA: hypothetical protein U2Q23_005342 [Burkholderia multivorans]|nr:hypothetical protein [Burkholderia multivorans]HEM7872399.1 hypothetical protein [Burkholderia multivorans]HEM7908060.1 hypothetical protein [Burkholderia multivorans]HEM8539164.1 hypothetical protein [Burkholderia multivorans]